MAVTAQEHRGFAEWLDRNCGPVMVLPAVIVILAFALFPLIISAYLALSRFALAPGGFTLRFTGLANFRKLLTGSQQYHLLGTFGTLGFFRWLLLALAAALLLYGIYRYFTRGKPSVMGTVSLFFRLSFLCDVLSNRTGTLDDAPARSQLKNLTWLAPPRHNRPHWERPKGWPAIL